MELKQQPSQLERFLGSSHISWLLDPRFTKAGISHNRLVDVRSGCVLLPVMHSIPIAQVAVIGKIMI